MSFHVHAYAATSPTKALGPFACDRRDPRPDDVVIDILFCGVCHSDLHNVRNDWNGANYPMVPGHEIIVAAGSDATRFKAGDTVDVLQGKF